jgi:hypothetical protein
METAYSGFAIIKDMVENGIPSSVSDAAVVRLVPCFAWIVKRSSPKYKNQCYRAWMTR